MTAWELREIADFVERWRDEIELVIDRCGVLDMHSNLAIYASGLARLLFQIAASN